MLLDPIFNRVDETMERAARSASHGAIVFVLALFALGFLTAAAHAYATALWGEIAGNLLIAGVFLFAAIIFHLSTASRQAAVVETPAPPAELDSRSGSALALADQLLNANGEVVKSLQSFAPVAAKAVAERVGPNLHLIIGAALGVFLASKLAEKLDRTKAPEA